MKKVISAKVIENIKIAEGIYKMTIGSGSASTSNMDFSEILKNAKAGQFINIYLDSSSMLLPRPISLCETTENSLTIVYKAVGKGTDLLSGYLKNQNIRISSSLGNGFFLEGKLGSGLEVGNTSGKALLVGGGVGVPPMIELAKILKTQGRYVIAVFGFQKEPFLLKEVEGYADEIYVTLDEKSKAKYEINGKIKKIFNGNVIECIEANKIICDELFSCGPKPMLKALAQYAESIDLPIQVSLEERMGCGYGACVGCTCNIKKETPSGTEIVKKGVCKDGPVFWGNEVAWSE